MRAHVEITPWNGETPPAINVVPNGMNPRGAIIVYGRVDFVTMPPDLGEQRANVVSHFRLDSCPVCHVESPTPAMGLDNGMAVSCCTRCGQYGWFDLPRKGLTNDE